MHLGLKKKKKKNKKKKMNYRELFRFAKTALQTETLIETE